MNRKRTDFKMPLDHIITITPYWLLGFVEGEGNFFIIRKGEGISFGIGQTVRELPGLEAIKDYLFTLPGSDLPTK